MLTPKLDVLAAPQRRLWDELSALPKGFVLYGGTALALRLGHRTSEDFDFFTNRGFSPAALETEAAFLARATRLQSGPNTLVVRVDRGGSVKLSFFGGLGLRRVGEPEIVAGPGFPIASLLDLAATKVKSVQDRAEARDYLDVATLLDQGIDLAAALGAARAVYGTSFNPILSLKALSYFGDGDLPSLPDATRGRLRESVNAVDPASLSAPRPVSNDIN